MKTHDEMKAEVLAYCEEVCPQSTKGLLHSISASIKLIHHMTKIRSWVLDFYDAEGSNEWLCTLCWIDEESNNEDIRMAYRILGLETRDAIAERDELHRIQMDATNEAMQEVFKALASERAKSAALVESLEEIRNICYEVDQNPDYTFAEDDAKLFVRIYDRAIEAYKKGGSNE